MSGGPPDAARPRPLGARAAVIAGRRGRGPVSVGLTAAALLAAAPLVPALLAAAPPAAAPLAASADLEGGGAGRCKAPRVELPGPIDLGAALDDAPASCATVIVPGGGVVTAYRVCENGTELDVGVDRERRVVFVRTGDPAFRTPEGVTVGSAIAELGSLCADPTLQLGWLEHCHLPSGWEAALRPSRGLGGGAPARPQRIVFFFRVAEGRATVPPPGDALPLVPREGR